MKTFKSADILLPKNADMSKWSVVACDQYTSEPEYWEEAEKIVGDAMSTLKITFPEAYLTKCDEQARIDSINKTMLELTINFQVNVKKLFCSLRWQGKIYFETQC